MALLLGSCFSALPVIPGYAQSGTIQLPRTDVEARRERERARETGEAKPQPSQQQSQGSTKSDKAFVAQSGTSGTKTNTPLLQTPQSISVVSRKQMEAQGVESVAEALRYEVGVVSESRVGDRFDNVFIRGFGGFGPTANYLHFWDGLRLPRGVSYAMPSIDPYLLDRVEILRGPASVLYGQNNPGGLVNLISKSPTEQPFREVWTGVGSYNRLEGGFDIGGPANQDGTLLYRVIGLGRKADEQVDYNKTERWLIAPSFTWRPNDQTQLTVRASYDHDPFSYQPNWLPAVGTILPNPNGPIPRNFFVGNPYFNTYDRTQSSVGYEFEHAFNEIWIVRQNFRYMHVDSVFQALSATGYAANSALCSPTTPPMACISRTRTYYVESLDAATVDNQAQARFVTGAFHHTVLAGVDYQWSSAEARFNYAAGPAATPYYVDYTNPQYSPVPTPALNATTDQRKTQTGTYLQDQIRIDRWAFVAGLRYDWANATSNTVAATTPPTNLTRPSDQALTWRAGATYLFDNGFAPYFSYSTSFEPVVGNDATGAAFKPTTGEQYEAGFKYQPLGFNGMFMLSLFDITQQNVLTATTQSASGSLCTPSGPFCQSQVGEVHSRGVEVSAKVTPFVGVDVIASYSYTDAEITKNTVAASIGRAPAGVPRNLAGLWAGYTTPIGPWKGWGFGGGVRYVGESNGDISSPLYIVPAYTLFDADIHYDLSRLDPGAKGWSFSVNATNLADKRYVSACATMTQCFYGNGRTVLGRLAYRW